MVGNVEHIASARKTKYFFHRSRAQYWTALFVGANALFALLLLMAGFSCFMSLGILIEGLFGESQKGAVSEGVRMLLSGLVWSSLWVTFAWWMISNVREIRNKHLRLAAGYAQKSAEEVLIGRSRKDSFGLFLRGFDFESRSTTYSGPNPEIGSEEAQIYARPVEALLVEILGEEVPLVALADPREPEPLPGVYRFETVPIDWLELLRSLLCDAFPVMIHLTSLTPGIELEMNILKSSGHSKKTVVIISRHLAVERGVADGRLLQSLAGFSHIVFEQTDRTWSRVSESQFHTRLRECLLTLERENQGRQLVKRDAAGSIKELTPTRRSSLLGFLKGPAFSASILMAPIIIPSSVGIEVLLLTGRWRFVSPRIFLSGVISSVGIWLGLVIALAVIKGVAYILGYATGPGDNPNFPGFSRMMKRIKNRSLTPR